MRNVLALLAVIVLVPALAAAQIIVTEISYNTPDDDVEWIELYNDSDASVDLTGWTIVDDLDHVFLPLEGTMAPGDVMVVIQTETLFNETYPDVTNYFPTTMDDMPWGLGNGGDEIFIFDDTLTQVFYMEYDDSGDWPTEADGDGPSLLLVSSDCADFSDGACWTAGEYMGTPGVLTGTVPNDVMSFGDVKALYR